MSNLRAIPTPEPDAEIVSLLEGLLERARRGEIKGIAVATHIHPTSTGSASAIGRDGDVAHLVTALERCKLRLLAIE